MAVLATVATLAAGAVQAVGTVAAGRTQAQALQQQAQNDILASEFEAKQLEIRANEERAAGQVAAEQRRKQTRLAQSRLQAVASASGFSATDPTSLALADEIAQYGGYQAALENYSGEALQTNLRERANAARFSGQSSSRARLAEAKSVRRGSYFSAAGTVLGSLASAGSTYAKYSQPSAPSTPYSGRYSRGVTYG